MTLSIIIPTYNRKSLIKYTLDSLDKKYHTAGMDYEVIVVDDGSTDDTEQIVQQEYSYVKFLKNNGKGASAARNTGLAIAEGLYVSYLDSDDLIGPGFFTEKVKALNNDPELNAVYGKYEYFESNDIFTDDKIIFKHKYPRVSDKQHIRLHLINYLSGNFIPSNAIVWRRAFLNKCNGHDDSLSVNQDVALFVKALFNHLQIRSIDDDTYAYIRHHNIDVRVGDPANQKNKFEQILSLRNDIFEQLKQNGYNEKVYHQALSAYLFHYWRVLRHTNKEMADKFLHAAKKIYWPVELKGNALYKMLVKLVGPVRAVKLKSFILKRD